MKKPATWRSAARGTTAATVAALMFTAPGAASAHDPQEDLPSPAPTASQSPEPAKSESKSQRTVDVQILGLNETHGQLTPLKRDGRPAGGAATLAAYLAQEEAENPRTLILDSGDFMQGPVISSYFEGASTVDVYNEIGVDAAAVGNHEFDWGQDAFAERVDQADFPFLAANIIDDGTGKAPDGVEPYIIENLKGVKVGIIGIANPDTKNVTLPAATEGLTFLDVAATADAVNAAVEELRDRKVETIIVSAHQGLESPTEGPLVDIVNQLSNEVDLVLSGHIPLEFNTTINGIPVVQPFGNTRGYADVTLTVDRASKDVVNVATELDATFVDEIEADSDVQAIVDGYQAQLGAELGQTVGAATTSIQRGASRAGESEMGNFVTDAMRNHLDGVDFAVTNAGGLRSDIDEGPITLAEVYGVLPFNNTLVTMSLTGAQVRQVLEEGANSQYGTAQVSGLKWAYNPAAPFGARVTSVTLPDGTPLDPATSYRVATNNFMATGGDEFTTLSQGANTVDTGINLVDTVVRYLETNSPVDPQVEGRLTVG
ncbi:bifunctional metallophosphatase/5'-nucleotidase [Arthrobacter sp. H41]|uniref:bifunctional metallophosphatase/5'-nucleotidase n=1 Tax=Arthrobacter sp. H41 TaxID=1312978 RepID=UPI00047D763B|nr:5'-nucleotidase C-terminal domain-containing protein [Arthrobacter sp. H41]